LSKSHEEIAADILIALITHKGAPNNLTFGPADQEQASIFHAEECGRLYGVLLRAVHRAAVDIRKN
jgi:hypothetical protein